MKLLNLQPMFFSVLVGVLSSITSFAQNANLPSVVYDASEFYIRGCEVTLNVGGKHNQLYVNGQLAGSYEIRTQDNELALAISNHLQSGVCNYKAESELQYLRDPNLIDAFAQRQFRNCSVRMYVERYHQLHIRNVFRGNYVAGFQDAKLRSVLTEHIVNGTCVHISNPHQPPQACTCTITNEWGSFLGIGPNCSVARTLVVGSCSSSHPDAVCSASQTVCQ